MTTEPPRIELAIEATIEPAPLPERPLAPTPGGGATCTFAGTTRAETHPEFGPLVALEYESAGPLAETVLRDLARSIAERHDLLLLRIRHAIGRVPVGEASVRIEAVAAHRDAAFVACREAIDRLKRDVPIWKRERWRDGATWSNAATPLATDSGTPPDRAPEIAR